jgi:hypothetical protein
MFMMKEMFIICYMKITHCMSEDKGDGRIDGGWMEIETIRGKRDEKGNYSNIWIGFTLEWEFHGSIFFSFLLIFLVLPCLILKEI